MKKVIALVMCVAMIACIAVTASAADPITFTVSNHENAKVGDVLEVTISVTEESDIGALELHVKLDDEYLEPTFITERNKEVWAKAGDASKNATASLVTSDGYKEGLGAYSIAAATADGYYLGDVVVTIFVEVIKELPAEGAAIDLTIVACDHYEDRTIVMETVAVDGLVKGEAKAPVVDPEDPEDPVDPPVVDPEDPEDPVDPPVVDPEDPEDPVDPPVVDPDDPEDPIAPQPPVVDPEDPEDPIAPPVVDPEDSVDSEDAIVPQPPVDNDKNDDANKAPVDTDTDTDKENVKTGDVTGIAVAAGLCAVMAAAFVITKKVND